MKLLVNAVACLLLAIGVDSKAAAFPVGTGPLVLFDTAHWNPPLTEGRYQSVADLLRADGYRIVAGAVPFSRAELSRYGVLFVATPYAANPQADPGGAAKSVFSEAECDALAAWVRTGGSLLLVVGHAPSGFWAAIAQSA